MSDSPISLAHVLEFDIEIDVVDIGANPIDGDAPYKSLLENQLVNLVGFEPNPKALEELNKIKGPKETYLPNAVYDGTDQEIKFCQAPGMTSLLEPNQRILEFMHGFPEWGKVISRENISTKRLDDIEQIQNMDYLKIDIQGGELEVFRNGQNRLEDCLVIHTEVEFIEMYENQPLFSEVEMFLRKFGMTFHKFEPLTSRSIQPMMANQNIFEGISQIVYADAIFIKDFSRLDNLKPTQLKKMAVILHDTYKSYDIVLRILMEHDTQAGTKYAEKYMSAS